MLSPQTDPYLIDTPASHRDGAWVAKQLQQSFGLKNTHWRGLHYSLVVRKKKVRKPNGEVFRNTEEDWFGSAEVAGKAARWLGYVPFERIIDRRNAPPVIYRRPREPPRALADASLGIEFPTNIGPQPVARGSSQANLCVRNLRGEGLTR